MLHDFDLTESVKKLKTAGLRAEGRDGDITTVEQGTRLVMKDADSYEGWPRLHLPKRIDSDCSITFDFQDLKMQPAEEGWGCFLYLRAFVENGLDTGVEVSLGHDRAKKQQLRTVRRHQTLAGATDYDARDWPSAANSGRFRIVRTGSTMTAYFAKADSEDFQPLEVWAVGGAPIKEIVVQCTSSDSAALLDVVAKRLTIETRSE